MSDYLCLIDNARLLRLYDETNKEIARLVSENRFDPNSYHKLVSKRTDLRFEILERMKEPL